MFRPDLSPSDVRDLLTKLANEMLSPSQQLKNKLRHMRLQEHLAKAENARLKRVQARKRRQYELSDQGVYVIGSAGEPIKIGIAKNADQRCRYFQTGHPHRLRVYAHIPVQPGRARDVEVACHKRLSDYRLSGEWFDYDPYDAIDLIRAVVAELECGV